MRRLVLCRLGLTLSAVLLGTGGALSSVHAGPATKPAYNAAAGNDAFDYAKWSSFWSFRPVSKPPVPTVGDSKNPIDAFVRVKLNEKGLEPAPEADKVTLVRRATFDLTGLPPTVEEVRAFVADASPVLV